MSRNLCFSIAAFWQSCWWRQVNRTEMDNKNEQSRRAFLAASAGLLSTLWIGDNAVWAEEGSIALAVRAMRGTTGIDYSSASQVAEAYWKIASEERDAATLTSRLCERTGTDCPASQPRAVMQTRLRDCITDDFREGRTVTVEGWVLSETEARLCALVATAPPYA